MYAISSLKAHSQIRRLEVSAIAPLRQLLRGPTRPSKTVSAALAFALFRAVGRRAVPFCWLAARSAQELSFGCGFLFPHKLR